MDRTKSFFESKTIVPLLMNVVIIAGALYLCDSSISGTNILINKTAFFVVCIIKVVLNFMGVYGRLKAERKISL